LKPGELLLKSADDPLEMLNAGLRLLVPVEQPLKLTLDPDNERSREPQHDSPCEPGSGSNDPLHPCAKPHHHPPKRHG
jgi:hypothetical protein